MPDLTKTDPSRDGAPVVWLVCASHRAREKLVGRGSNTQGYHLAFSGHDIRHHGIYPIPVEQSHAALKIKGVRRLSLSRAAGLMPCWSF